MCGFTLILDARLGRLMPPAELIDRMTDTLTHRGPDDRGVWNAAEDGLAFGFRRLAIVDLSAEGHQPMASGSGRFMLLFNGEVFNHRELRDNLVTSGASFRGHSDTEVILAGFEQWGIDATVRRCVGMFAMAIWDTASKELVLVRDRLGIKPLYLHERSGLIVAASELRAILAHPEVDGTVDLIAGEQFLDLLYVPAPRSIIRDIRKVRPGHLVRIRGGVVVSDSPYWDLESTLRAGAVAPVRSDEAAIDALHDLLRDAVRLRMEADVPIGALLSGGIDSTLVTALMQEGAADAVRTYSVGFEDAEHDESHHAARVASHLGTRHTLLPVGAADALALVPRLSAMCDEPNANASFLPTYLVFALARQQVTVALTGDGGDELFGGYNRYVLGESIVRRSQRLPQPLRRALGFAASLSANGLRASEAAHRAGSRLLGRFPAVKLDKLAALLDAGDAGEMYLTLMRTLGAGTLSRNSDIHTELLQRFNGAAPRDIAARMMAADQGQYLPDDLLAKVDRASMAVSLEARVPLLDHRVVEFSWTLTPEQKIRGNIGKWILREILDRHVPRALVDRPKVGFTVPLAGWLRGPLRLWSEERIETMPPDFAPIVDGMALRKAWVALDRGDDSVAPFLWAHVMLSDWYAVHLASRA